MGSRDDERPTVLVVEDDGDIRELVVDVLINAGYRVESATDGAGALDWVRRRSAAPTLIILDARMPVMDGTTFLRGLVGEAPHRQIGVVVFTAGDPNVDGLVRMPLVRGVLRKPATTRQILATVSECWPEGLPADGRPSMSRC